MFVYHTKRAAERSICGMRFVSINTRVGAVKKYFKNHQEYILPRNIISLLVLSVVFTTGTKIIYA